MMETGILNDFAGYRRVVGKVHMDKVPGMKVDEAATGTISMWAADHAPFTAKVATPRKRHAPSMIVTLRAPRRARGAVNRRQSQRRCQPKL